MHIDDSVRVDLPITSTLIGSASHEQAIRMDDTRGQAVVDSDASSPSAASTLVRHVDFVLRP